MPMFEEACSAVTLRLATDATPYARVDPERASYTSAISVPRLLLRAARDNVPPRLDTAAWTPHGDQPTCAASPRANRGTAATRDGPARCRAIQPATRRAVAPQPATNRYSGPKARSDVIPTKYSPGTLLPNSWFRTGIPRSGRMSARSDGWIIVNLSSSTRYPVAKTM